MVVPPKIKNRITLRSSNSTSGYIPKRSESRVLKRNLEGILTVVTQI